MCDKYGSLYRGNPEMNSEQAKLAELTNPDNLDVKLDEAIVDADLFIGVSAPGILTEEMVAKWLKIQSCLLWQILFRKLCLTLQRRQA